MNTNHAKAIKGMSIANIVLAALGLLGVLAIWAMLGVSGAAIDGSGYDYFYTDDGYYMETSDVTALLGLVGGMVGFLFVGCLLILVAGIIGLRGAANPEKLKGVMVWNIVGAVAALLSGSWISLVLCIIVAVFANKDKNLYAAPAAPYGYGAPVPPVAPVAPAAPVAPMAPQQPAVTPVAPQQPAEAPVTPTVPVAEQAVTAVETVAAAEAPAVILPDNNVEDVMEGVTVVEAPVEPAADDDKPTA